LSACIWAAKWQGRETLEAVIEEELARQTARR
jgi:hypothetical protein